MEKKKKKKKNAVCITNTRTRARALVRTPMGTSCVHVLICDYLITTFRGAHFKISGLEIYAKYVLKTSSRVLKISHERARWKTMADSKEKKMKERKNKKKLIKNSFNLNFWRLLSRSWVEFGAGSQKLCILNFELYMRSGKRSQVVLVQCQCRQKEKRKKEVEMMLLLPSPTTTTTTRSTCTKCTNK